MHFISPTFTTGLMLRQHSRKRRNSLLRRVIAGTRCMRNLAASAQTLSATSKCYRRSLRSLQKHWRMIHSCRPTKNSECSAS